MQQYKVSKLAMYQLVLKCRCKSIQYRIFFQILKLGKVCCSGSVLMNRSQKAWVRYKLQELEIKEGINERWPEIVCTLQCCYVGKALFSNSPLFLQNTEITFLFLNLLLFFFYKVLAKSLE